LVGGRPIIQAAAPADAADEAVSMMSATID